MFGNGRAIIKKKKHFSFNKRKLPLSYFMTTFKILLEYKTLFKRAKKKKYIMKSDGSKKSLNRFLKTGVLSTVSIIAMVSYFNKIL